MARVTLIDPRGWQGLDGGQRPYPNVGIGFLIPPLLRAGHRVDVIDMNNGLDSDEDALQRIVAFSPDVVGFSIKTATVRAARSLGRAIRAAVPQTPVLVGGPHATLCADELVEEDWIDAVMAGEGEECISDVVEHLADHRPPQFFEGALRQPAPEEKLSVRSPLVSDLDAIEFPEYSLFPAAVQARLVSDYPLLTSRGCVFNCTYCSVPNISGRRFRRRSAAAIVRELTWARKRWGIASFELIDDSFNIDIERSKEICRTLIEARLGLRWTCPNGIRADLIDDELAALMASAGCWMVMLGVEHAEPRILRSVNKGESIQEIEDGVRCLQGAGIEVGAYFIIGLPGDSLAATRTSLEWARRLGVAPHFNMLVPYPGTAIWSWVREHGRPLIDIESGLHFSSDGTLLPVFETDEFPAAQRLRAWEMVHTATRRFDMILPQRRRRWLDPLRKAALVFRHDRRHLVPSVVRASFRAARRVLRTPLLRAAPAGARGTGSPPVSPRGRARRRTPGRGAEPAPRMRLLVVSNYYPPHVIGGYEIACSAAVEWLRERGHAVSVLTSCSGEREVPGQPLIRRQLVSSLGWGRMPAWEYALRVLHKERKNRTALRRCLEEQDFDVVFFWNLRFVSASLLEVALARGVPIATYVFDDWMASMAADDAWIAWRGHRPAGALQAALKRLLVRLAPLPFKEADPSRRRWPNVMFGSEYLRKRCIEAGTVADDGRVVYWGVDLNVFAPPAAAPNAPKKLLYCGQVVPIKGVDTVIEAFAVLTRGAKYPELRLTIAGGSTQPAYVEALKAKSRSLGLGDRVHFTGAIAHESIPQLLREHHLLVFPSIWEEPFGIVLLEAMASGLVVAASATGGAREVVRHGENALVFAKGDPEDCARALATILEDDSLFARLRSRAREYVVERHDLARTLEAIERRLLTVAGSRADSRTGFCSGVQAPK